MKNLKESEKNFLTCAILIALVGIALVFLDHAGLSEPKGTGGPVIQPDFHVSYPDIFNRCGGLDHWNY